LKQRGICLVASRRVARALLGLAAAAAITATACGQDAAETRPESETKVDWQAFADCAAAYRANVKNRESDPSRTPEMRSMIEEQADEYNRAALRAYVQARHANEEAASEAVKARIDGSIDRFVAMDKAGKLDRFLDECPQLDAE
jgi:hypothetical protein